MCSFCRLRGFCSCWMGQYDRSPIIHLYLSLLNHGCSFKSLALLVRHITLGITGFSWDLKTACTAFCLWSVFSFKFSLSCSLSLSVTQARTLLCCRASICSICCFEQLTWTVTVVSVWPLSSPALLRELPAQLSFLSVLCGWISTGVLSSKCRGSRTAILSCSAHIEAQYQ